VGGTAFQIRIQEAKNGPKNGEKLELDALSGGRLQAWKSVLEKPQNRKIAFSLAPQFE
jgi:hypothetical protein